MKGRLSRAKRSLVGSTANAEEDEPSRASSAAGTASATDATSAHHTALPEPDSGPRPFSWRGDGDALLADDEPTVLHVAARALARLGLTVTSCANGREAVDRFAPEPMRWRLIVLDLTMPVLSGDEALKQIRALRADVPVLLFSGFAEEDVRDRFASQPRVEFLQKPFTVRSLSDAVLALLGPPD